MAIVIISIIAMLYLLLLHADSQIYRNVNNKLQAILMSEDVVFYCSYFKHIFCTFGIQK